MSLEKGFANTVDPIEAEAVELSNTAFKGRSTVKSFMIVRKTTLFARLKTRFLYFSAFVRQLSKKRKSVEKGKEQ